MVKFFCHQWYTPELLRAYPGYLFLFGDNLQRIGKGGQAIIRDEPNAFGIATKKGPGMEDEDFFRDDMYCFRALVDDFGRLRIPPQSERIVVPSAGLGTGLAQLPTRAPKLYRLLNQFIGAIPNAGEYQDYRDWD